RLGVIETQVARLIEIISRLLDATRRVPSEPTAVDLNALARDTAELVRPGLARARLTLEVRTEPGLPTVLGQRDQLQQVILNLLTNAIDATPHDGRVEMTTRSRPGQDEVEIAIADTGLGISPADRKHDLDGLAVLKQLAMIQPDLPVVILTAFATIETAIEAVNAGAFDYLSKPFRMEEIKIVVRRTLDARRLARENLQYRQELGAR